MLSFILSYHAFVQWQHLIFQALLPLLPSSYCYLSTRHHALNINQRRGWIIQQVCWSSNHTMKGIIIWLNMLSITETLNKYVHCSTINLAHMFRQTQEFPWSFSSDSGKQHMVTVIEYIFCNWILLCYFLWDQKLQVKFKGDTHHDVGFTLTII